MSGWAYKWAFISSSLWNKSFENKLIVKPMCISDVRLCLVVSVFVAGQQRVDVRANGEEQSL